MTDKLSNEQVLKVLEGREEALFGHAAEIIEEARRAVVRTTRTTMVHAYWLIGREIVEVEQHGTERAKYGEQLMARLGVRLSARFGGGFGARTIRRIRQFYLAYPQGSLMSDGRSHENQIWSAVLTKSGDTPSASFPAILG